MKGRGEVRTWLIVIIVLCCLPGVGATVLYFAQGGFGGGHGRHDYAIYMLTFPGGWILGSAYMDLTGGLPDLVAMIWVPVILNIVLAVSAVLVIGLPARKYLASDRESDPE